MGVMVNTCQRRKAQHFTARWPSAGGSGGAGALPSLALRTQLRGLGCGAARRLLWLFATSMLLLSAAGEAEPAYIPDAVWEQHGKRSPIGAEADVAAAAGRMSFGLFIVLLLLGGGLLAARKVLQRRGGLLPGGRHLQLLESLPVGVKRSVQLIRVQDQLLVIGSAENGLQYLATLPAASVDSALPAPPLASESEPTADAAAEAIAGSGRLQNFRDRLQALRG